MVHIKKKILKKKKKEKSYITQDEGFWKTKK